MLHLTTAQLRQILQPIFVRRRDSSGLFSPAAVNYSSDTDWWVSDQEDEELLRLPPTPAFDQPQHRFAATS